jgi:hypothetical protein
MLDVLLRRHSDASEDDQAIVDSSEGRMITCHVRANFEPFPSRWSVGNLHLVSGVARWRRGTRRRGGGDVVPPIRVRTVRNVAGREALLIKKGLFRVIEAESDQGEICLAVPANSAELVARLLSTHP